MLDFYDLNLKNYQIVDWGYTEELAPVTFSHYEAWVDKGYAGDLKYLTDHRKDLRRNLKNFWQDSESALVFLFSYANTKFSLDEFLKKHENWNHKKISGYAFGFDGNDYHEKIADHLNTIIAYLKTVHPALEAKIAIDIHPVTDRDLAYRSGLGFFGKNAMLISKKHGSFLLIGSILLNQKLDLLQKKVETDHCGQCTRCIDACPTIAITNERTIIASNCISTFTIETFKDGPPPAGMEKANEWIFGCDICQDVCPWNKRVARILKDSLTNNFVDKVSNILDFFLLRKTSDVIQSLKEMSKKKYGNYFKGTSFERLGKNGMLKNLKNRT